MTRILSLAAALATSVILLGASAHAQTGPYYSATPVAAPTKASVITAGNLWKCAGGVCSARESTQRDIIMCQMIAQRVGALSAFAVKGAAFDEAALAKCNASARS
ncbi:MAG: CC_3452 family protein [Sphingomonas sp.]